MFCAPPVLCVILLLPLNSLSRAEGIPAADARSAAKKFQNALTQQNLQTVLLSIEERLRNLDNVYAMQYSPGVEGKLEMYGRKLESVEAKIARLEAVMGNEMDKISENISSRNFKDDLARDHVLRRIDSVYERVNHRLILAESKMELMEQKLENKLDTVLSKMEKMEDSLEIKDADMQAGISDVLTCIDDLKMQSTAVEQKLTNVSKTLTARQQRNVVGPFQADESTVTLASENITATVRKDMKENFEVLSNKMVDFHETSWQTYERLEKTLKSMSFVGNLTRYEIQNGLRSLTVEVGRLSGGQGLLSDPGTGKVKLHEIVRKIDSNFESLMLAQNLFMENCYRLQKDEPQLETKISEVLNEMITSFNSKTAVAPKDIRKLEQAIKNHDQGVKNALKGLNTILHKSHVSDTKIEDGLRSLNSSLLELGKINSANCVDNNETVKLLKNIQKTIAEVKIADANITNSMKIDKLEQMLNRLESFIKINAQEVSSIRDGIMGLNRTLTNIGNKTTTIGFLFTEHYSRHLKLFLDQEAQKYLKKINEIFTIPENTAEIKPQRKVDNMGDNNCTLPFVNASAVNCLMGEFSNILNCFKNITNLHINRTANISFIDPKVVETVKIKCFNASSGNAIKNLTSFEKIIEHIYTYCTEHRESGIEDCLNWTTRMEKAERVPEKIDEDIIETIISKCLPAIDIRHSINEISLTDCLRGVLNESTIGKIKNYCFPNEISSDCLRNLTGSSPISQGEIVKLREVLNANCSPKIDLRISSDSPIEQCAKRILDNVTISRIVTYCSSINSSMSTEECFNYITDAEDDNDDILDKITENVKDAIRTNCFSEIDVRASDSFSLQCLKGILSKDDIKLVRSYCSRNMIQTEEACIDGIINTSKTNITKRHDDSKFPVNGNATNSTENVQQVNSTNANAISMETATEIDYYQPPEITEHNDYDDYSSRVY